MNRKELSQLYYLNREIEEQQRRLEELEALATSCTSYITGMPKSYNIIDKMATYTAEIADLNGLIDLNIKKCFYQLNRLNRFIASINDSEVRMILSLRYVNGLCWTQVAASISPYATDDSVKKRAYRFLRNIE
jgi:hypothetical protein